MSVVQAMGQEPTKDWTDYLGVIDKLAIKTAEDVHMWVNLGAVARLLKLIKREHCSIDPEYVAANVVSKLLYADEANEELKRAILESNCAKEIIASIDSICDFDDNCFETLESLILLLGNISYTLPQFRLAVV